MRELWKQVWAEMTDSELADRLFTYLWLSLHTPNAHASRIAQLIQEAERRGQVVMVERARGMPTAGAARWHRNRHREEKKNARYVLPKVCRLACCLRRTHWPAARILCHSP
jgi:hypothetical protein